MKMLPHIELRDSAELTFVTTADNDESVKIPSWPLPAPPDDRVIRNYKMTVNPNATTNKIDIFFSERPADPPTYNDTAREMRVPGPCLIKLELDTSMWDWEFRHTDAVKMDPTATANYYNLVHNIDVATGRCNSVQFHAEFNGNFPGPGTNRDEFYVYVILGQDGAPPMGTRFDPDIKNPGDDPAK